MPRRSAEQGVKPFELRTGVGGLPPLGGIYRAGDPATIPPFKHHMVVNCRIKPAGLFSRDGLVTVFDTGVEECINGMTEYGDEQGQALMLYAGADGVTGPPDFNIATFRAIFPGQSMTYSEFVFVLEGEAGPVDTWSPVVSPHCLTTGHAATTAESNPFLFRDRIHQFRSASGILELWELPLPERSFLQAADCSRDSSTVASLTALATKCVAVPGTGPDSIGQKWPFNHPVSQAIRRVSFTIAGSTNPALYRSSRVIGDPRYLSEPGVSFAICPERVDDPLTGAVGVADVLYVLVTNVTGADYTLCRWDGVSLGIEHQLPVGTLTLGFVTVCIAPSGPVIYGEGWDPIQEAQISYRDDDGVWHDDGIPMTVPLATYYISAWKSFDGGLVLVTKQQIVSVTELSQVTLQRFSADSKHAQIDDQVVWSRESNQQPSIIDACLAAGTCYALLVAPGASTPVLLASLEVERTIDPDASFGYWIQAVGDRVYVGGAFTDAWDPITQGPVAIGKRHCVFDVTDFSDIFLVYEVLDSAQDFDNNGNETHRIARGCLPGLPGGGSTSEGFGETYG